MRKIFKYLMESAIPILIIIGLLILQAVCDLALPTYTSNIVNIGIQQGGVQSTVPSIIREETFNQLMLFMKEEEKELVQDSYKLVKLEELEGTQATHYKKQYPIIRDTSLYERTGKGNQEQLKAIFEKSIFIATTLQKQENSGQIKDQVVSQGQFQAMISQMSVQLEQIPDSIVEQSAMAYVKEEYDAIGMNMEQIQNSYILLTGAKMIGISLLVMATTILVCLLAARVAAKLGVSLRTRLFRKVVSFSSGEMDEFSTASLITRSTNDIQQVQMFVVMLLRMVFYAPILGIGGVIKVFRTNSSMSWIIAVAVAAVLCVVLILFAVAMPKFKIMQTLVDKVNLITREILTGLPVIRAFSTERHEEKRFDAANQDLMKTQLFTNRIMAFMMPVMMLIMNCITLLIVWSGAKGIDLGQMQVGDMMAFMQYTMQIIMSFLMLTMVSIMLPRASVAMNRIDEVLNTKIMLKDKENTKTLDNKTGTTVEFDHVCFRYPNAKEDVLHDITFIAKPGETTAIIGSTGCGKSTLVNLIPRFYDVTEGQIKIDGIDIRELSQHNLREQLGFVPQKGILFSGTIDSNLRYGKQNATKEEIQKAATIAQAIDFIEEKSEKYESAIAQGGSNVSGGQKQRLSIARAIAKQPKIYIFDDSFSALDYKTDIALRKALQEETGDSTVIIVAQRISTILHAQQIIVLDEGKIAGIGTHKQLLETNEVYQQIAMSQLSAEELA